MTAEPNRLEALFTAALAMPSPEARAAYLAQACAGDTDLRRRVDALLAAHDEAGSFLQRPAAGEGVLTDLPAGQWFDPQAIPPFAEGPGTRIGPYKLLQQIGEGGMGVVWMAEQQSPIRRMVALKIIKPGMDSASVVARFEAERQALAMMDHQNIARVFDGGTVGQAFEPDSASESQARKPDLQSGRPFFVMELVKGIPITRFCDDNRLTPRERLELFIPVCQAVQHAHQKGVIHRDLKPSNVLVTLYDGKPVPKVIDFGVAKALHQKLTEKTMFTAFGAVIGTLEYMSPEQAELNALDVDTRSDVYSLGVLLYELLTGATPLERERLRKAAYTEVLRLIREEEAPRPSTRLSGSGVALARISAQRKTEPALLARLVRGELDWIVMKSLEKERSRRYETASGFARDVERYLKDEPVEACPPSVGYRIGKFARKNRVVLSTVAAFVALLLVAVGVSSWLAVAERQAKTVAEKAEKEAGDERDKAKQEWGRAEEAARNANESADETRRALNRLTVAKGIQLAEEGKLFTALPWFVKPLERGGLTPEEEKVHRTRIACYLRYTKGRPRLRQMLFCDRQLSRGVGFSPQMAFSADGKRVLVEAGDGIYVWDLQLGKRLATLQHPAGVKRVQFSPDVTAQFSPDGTRILAVLDDVTVCIWDALTGRRLGPPVNDWGGLLQRPLTLLPTSPWQFLVSAGASWEEIGWIWSPGDSNAVSATISQDGRRALFTFNQTLRLLDLETHKLIGQWPRTRSHALTSDGKCLLQLDGNLVRVHNTTAGKTATRSIVHGSRVDFVAFSPDETRVLTLGENGIVRVWDALTWEPLARIRVTESTKHRGFNAAMFSPDNRLLACCYTGVGHLAWWDVESGRLVREAPDYGDFFSGFDWRPDGQQLVRCSSSLSSGEATLWDAASGWEMGLVLPHVGVLKAVYAPDGRTLATVGIDGAVRIWDLCDRDEAITYQTPEKDSYQTRFQPRVETRRSTSYQLAHTYEKRTLIGSKQFTWLNPSRLLPRGTSFKWGVVSPDQSRVVTCHDSPNKAGPQFDHVPDSMLQLWDTKTRQRVNKPLEFEGEGFRCLFTCVVFSPDSRLVVMVTSDGTARLLSTRTGEPIGRTIKHGGQIHCAVFSPDSELLVTCGADTTVRLWRTNNCEPTGEILRHADEVTLAAFTRSGKFVATASMDGNVRLWDVGRRTQVGVLEIRRGYALDMAFHPNGLLMVFFRDAARRIPMNFSQGRIRIWDVAVRQEVSPAVNTLDFCEFSFLEDGRAAFEPSKRRTWNLAPDARAVGDLVKLAQLYSGQRLDAQGGSAPLHKAEQQALWEELRVKYPEEFAVPPNVAVDWRIDQLQLAPKRARPSPFEEHQFSSKRARATEIAFCRRWLASELTESGWQPGERGNENMERENYLHRLYALALHGRHTEATTAADALAARWPKDGDTLYGCACVHALAAGAVKADAALADRYAARAVALLRQAAIAGFRDGEHFLKDPDLDALRKREDFIQLLWDLA